MMTIKIQCECGQRYAFDFEPADGGVPSGVTCPTCGVDGTAAANAAIAQSMSAPPPVAPSGKARLRVAAPVRSDHPATTAAPARTAERVPGQIDRAQAEVEARAKILWGDPPGEVIAYLVIQGFSREEGSSLVQELFQERAATIRGDGIKKIVTGIGLMCVPIVAFVIFMIIRVIYVTVFGFTILAGFWGAWTVIKGISMVVSPKTQPGDVVEQ